MGREGASSVRNDTRWPLNSPCTRAIASPTTSLTSSGTFSMSDFFASARTRRITSLARQLSLMTHSTERRHARYMCEFRLRLAQCLFGVICADHRRNIGAGPTITKKIAACVKEWLAACSDVYRGAARGFGAVDEIAKWPMCVEHRPMQSPFFGFRFDIACNIPARHAGDTRGRDSGSIQVFRHLGDKVVRSGLPEPIGGRFGIVAKALLALAKGDLGPLAVLDVGSRPVPFDNVARLIVQRFGAE